MTRDESLGLTPPHVEHPLFIQQDITWMDIDDFLSLHGWQDPAGLFAAEDRHYTLFYYTH